MKRGTLKHPKVKRFAREIRMPSFSAIGLLESLWHWTAEQCPEGDIGRFEDTDIADGVDWPSERSVAEFTDALVTAKLVDRHPTKRLIIHDWSEHADRAVHQKLHRWGRNFADGYAPFERIKRGSKTEEKDTECTKDDFENTACSQTEAPHVRAWPEPVSSIQRPEKLPPPAAGARPIPTGPDPEPELHAAVNRIAAFWPNPGRVPYAITAACNEFGLGKPGQSVADWTRKVESNAMLHADHHRRGRQSNSRHFIPTLERWFVDGDYSRDPPEQIQSSHQPTPAKTTAMQRVMAKIQAEKEKANANRH